MSLFLCICCVRLLMMFLLSNCAGSHVALLFPFLAAVTSPSPTGAVAGKAGRRGGRGKSSRTKAEDDKVKPLLGFVVYCRLNYKKRITLKSMRLGTCYSKGNIIECDCYFTKIIPTTYLHGQSQFNVDILKSAKEN